MKPPSGHALLTSLLSMAQMTIMREVVLGPSALDVAPGDPQLKVEVLLAATARAIGRFPSFAVSAPASSMPVPSSTPGAVSTPVPSSTPGTALALALIRTEEEHRVRRILWHEPATGAPLPETVGRSVDGSGTGEGGSTGEGGGDGQHADVAGDGDANAITPSFTVIDFSQQGTDAATPIIELPQVAALGFGRTAPCPVPTDIDASGVATWRVGHRIWLSLSFDHMVHNGDQAGRFLAAVAEGLQS